MFKLFKRKEPEYIPSEYIHGKTNKELIHAVKYSSMSNERKIAILAELLDRLCKTKKE